MTHESKLIWNNSMNFNASIGEHNIILDADYDFGGNNLGPSPKPLLLTALAGCSGMDVVSILSKMRIPFKSCEILVSGVLTEDHPKYYKQIHIKYIISGENLPYDKLERAVNLSLEKYCGVAYMLGKASELTHEIINNN